MKMITIAFLLMLVLFIAAGATQLWVLAMIGGGIFLITLLMYLMATNDVLNAIVIMIVAIGTPILYYDIKQSWVLYVSYIAIGLWLNSGSITDNDVYIEWTFEGKVYDFFDERATDALIHLFSFIYAAIWGFLAYLGTEYLWFLPIPSIYLVVRSLIVLIKSRDYYAVHSFMLFKDIGNFFRSFGYGIKRFFTGGRSSGRNFSVWNLFIPLILVGLAVGLVFLEKNNSYSNFAKTLELTNLFDSSSWFHFTLLSWNNIQVVCESLSDSLPFFGDLLSLPLAALLFIVTVGIAVIELILSFIWVLICLIVDKLIPFIIGFLLLYIAPALLPIGILVLLILSFTLNHSIFNRIWNILCVIIIGICCYYYYTLMNGGTPIIPLPF